MTPVAYFRQGPLLYTQCLVAKLPLRAFLVLQIQHPDNRAKSKKMFSSLLQGLASINGNWAQANEISQRNVLTQ